MLIPFSMFLLEYDEGKVKYSPTPIYTGKQSDDFDQVSGIVDARVFRHGRQKITFLAFLWYPGKCATAIYLANGTR